MDASGFDREFGRWAARVRARRTFKHALTGAAVGAAAGALLSLGLWQARRGPERPFSAGVVLIGAAAGVALGRKRRLDDQEVALYLDGRFASGEVISTALELRPEPESEARDLIMKRATLAMVGGDVARVKPPILSPLHLGLPLGALAVAYVSFMPLPTAPAAPKPPGSDKVMLAEVRGLEKVATLSALSARDEDQKKRLEKIAKDASALREKLRDGVDRRDALAEIARLQDAVQAEKLTLGDGEKRQGLEAAIARLAKDPLTQSAAKALGDRDLVKFDEEMQKIANEREKADRERVKKILEEAAEAAKKAGAADVEKQLQSQRDSMDKRGARADELKALEKALEGSLTEEQKRDLQDFADPKSDKDAKKLAQKMNDALKKLTPEERKRLAENLKKQLQQKGDGMAPESRDRLRDRLKDLDSAEGQKQLEDELRRLANEETEDAEAERQKGLEGAENGLGEAQKGLGAAMPMPGAGDGKAGGKDGKDGDGKDGDGKDGNGKNGKDGKDGRDGKPGGGGNGDGGSAEHKGRSADVKGGDLRSRAQAKVNGKAPAAGITMGRTAGRAGDTANLRGTGAIGEVGPSELGGVDKNEVPEEYREQVGRYFQPLELGLCPKPRRRLAAPGPPALAAGHVRLLPSAVRSPSASPASFGTGTVGLPGRPTPDPGTFSLHVVRGALVA